MLTSVITIYKIGVTYLANRRNIMFTLNDETPKRVAVLLNNLSMSQQRIRLVYGNTETGKDWLEEYDVIGTVGRSTGIKQIPLLINNSRSLGGGAILDHCILKIVDVKSKRVLYQHEKYITPEFTIQHGTSVGHGYNYAVLCNNTVHANFKTEEQAKNYIDFMLCKRMRK